jgi:hypothetical protein
MATRQGHLARLPAAFGRRVRRAYKHLYQATRWRRPRLTRVLFIVGCQRSGTTLMTRLFDTDINCRVFGEHGELSSADKATGIRLKPLPEVAAILSRVRAPLVVAKPLVETQNVRNLLEHFPGSRALFMYRRYADVARSDLAKFGPRNGIDNLRPIVTADAADWRSAGATHAVRELARRFYSPHMNPHDAAALFWLARNQLFFDLNLSNDPAVLLCRYEHLTIAPVKVLRRIYQFVGLDGPVALRTGEVRPAIPVATQLDLSPEIRACCERLQGRLDAHFSACWT